MNKHSTQELSVGHALRDGVARAAAVVALAGVGLIHLLDIPGKFQDTPYMGWMYVGLIAGSILTAGALIRGSDSRAWLAAALLPLGAIVGYALSRTVGLPQAMDDIGNWGEPLGMASLFVEGSLVALSAMVLRERAGAFDRSALVARPSFATTARSSR
jgi:hypothetical protein